MQPQQLQQGYFSNTSVYTSASNPASDSKRMANQLTSLELNTERREQKNEMDMNTGPPYGSKDSMWDTVLDLGPLVEVIDSGVFPLLEHHHNAMFRFFEEESLM